MAQRSHSPRGRPGHRADPARPPRTRRGGDRPPYPGARTHTTADSRSRRAGTRPASTANRSRRAARTTPTAPTPATVWTCGPEPIDTHHPWPVPIVETITTAFTTPRAHVLLVDVDAATATAATDAPEGTATTGETPVTAARDTVRGLDRTTDTLTFDARAGTTVAASRPFWADMVTSGEPPPTALADTPANPPSQATLEGSGAPAPDTGQRADLVLASLPAHAAEVVALDRLALLAAHQLNAGGILAVHTHSDWNQGRLVDPTGAVVAAAQHADLLYLQHIVVLHTPVRDGHLHATPTPAEAAEYERVRHRAMVRRQPAPHLRVHSDVLVFAQPADRSTVPSPAANADPADTTEAGGGEHG